MRKDGHIHSPYCPHGTTDPFEWYIEKAIKEQFTHITFTEHAPLPIGFIDPTPDKDSGMKQELLQKYIDELSNLKKQYKNDISILIGLEVDYIEGYEEETRQFLNEVGPNLDDAILSVHFLKWENTYTCIDFSKEEYLHFAKLVGGIQKMYDLYYETLKKSIEADLGPYKPKRIGHPTLIHKFQLAHYESIDDSKQIKDVLNLMKEHNYELDVNSAGFSKQYCQESYPPKQFIDYAKSISLPLVFGSDAHQASDLHQHYEKIGGDYVFQNRI